MLRGSFRDKSEEQDAQAFVSILRRGIQIPDGDPVAKAFDDAYDQIDREEEEKTTGSDLSETDR